MIVAVLPFLAVGEEGPSLEADPNDLARWAAAQVAGALSIPGVCETRLVLDVVEIAVDALSAAAAQLQADFALGATFKSADGELEISALLADAEGNERGAWTETVGLGSALGIGHITSK